MPWCQICWQEPPSSPSNFHSVPLVLPFLLPCLPWTLNNLQGSFPTAKNIDARHFPTCAYDGTKKRAKVNRVFSKNPSFLLFLLFPPVAASSSSSPLAFFSCLPPTGTFCNGRQAKPPAARASFQRKRKNLEGREGNLQWGEKEKGVELFGTLAESGIMTLFGLGIFLR